MNIGYVTVSKRSSDAFVNYDYLSSFTAEKETDYLRHINFQDPVTVLMDGRNSVSLVTKAGVSLREKQEKIT
jgi:hypothetical protein